MKKLLILSFILLVSVIATACGTSSNEQETTQGSEGTEESSEEQAPEIPVVEVTFESDPLPVEEETTIQATVTQGGEPVEDAEYVDFEIWNKQDGKDNSTTVESEHVGDGVYEITHSFEKAGTYEMFAHTQVGDLHTMPKKTVQVGEKMFMEDEPSETSDDEQGHGDGKFMVHLKDKQDFKAEGSSDLVTHINKMEQPFKEAMVRYEIVSDQLDKHEYIDAEETNPGEYTATFTFPTTGSYTVKVHYEKPDEEIHGHQEIEVKVQ
ncbi:FixH family protein [Halobacillus locisalis]|uniref:FixH family protein n=1 Tax=Halobacillus locisalis TaxID=220753 RepID=A0A838CXB5_9BACI|nr:FixH family protein [Halobacillus locisalis]MBA2176479.1 FixH family protein [Halobacillus locisalis]